MTGGPGLDVGFSLSCWCLLQPQGLTLARADGPTTEDVTLQKSGECEITPSTDVKYPQGSFTVPHSQWLLIGESLMPHTWQRLSDQSVVVLIYSIPLSSLGRLQA